jgi:predicted nucleic acid binding AN1-type Zn finger protein
MISVLLPILVFCLHNFLGHDMSDYNSLRPEDNTILKIDSASPVLTFGTHYTCNKPADTYFVYMQYFKKFYTIVRSKQVKKMEFSVKLKGTTKHCSA